MSTEEASSVPLVFDGAVAAASVVCFVVAVLANAGGIGGGGVFVPLLMLVVGLSGKWVGDDGGEGGGSFRIRSLFHEAGRWGAWMAPFCCCRGRSVFPFG